MSRTTMPRCRPVRLILLAALVAAPPPSPATSMGDGAALPDGFAPAAPLGGPYGSTRRPAQPQATGETGVTARFRGVSAPTSEIVWASGTGGTVVRTTDGGANWDIVSIAGAEGLDLRDIDAFDADLAYALSIGSGADSRIFKTGDGGAHWETQFVNSEADGFFDAMSFWDRRRGLAVSDSIDGAFYVLRTEDGGATWSRIPPASLPAALPGEGYFAASGSNVTTWGTDHAWFGTGAAARARVARSTDGGLTWEIADTPLAAGPTAGIYSIAFRDTDHGVVVGGDYRFEDEAVDNAAFTEDGGRTWYLATGPPLAGFRSAVAYFPGTARRTLLALGPTGVSASPDDGRSWVALPAPPPRLHALSCPPSGTVCWGAGDGGRVQRIDGPGR